MLKLRNKKTPLDGVSGLKTHCIPPTHRRLHLKQLKFKVTTKQFRFDVWESIFRGIANGPKLKKTL
jgi:hypothetical protein